jgi:AraC-like DNA-binding protein
MSSIFCSCCHFTEPWALELPAFPSTLMFHVVTSGWFWLEVEGIAPRLLRTGDLGLVPHGEGHRVASAPGVPGPRLWDVCREQISDRYEIIRHGGGGSATNLICGTVRFDHPAARHLVGLLPRVIGVETSDSTRSEWMQSTLRLVEAETREMRPGGETVVTRLADVLVIQAIREWIERDPEAQRGWLGALRDRQVGCAIALIHREPARPWTVGSLADEVAMSRSAFAARFADLVGEPPMRYVARWRMQAALTWLQEDKATLGELALRLGYRSEAAFARAFKRLMGVAPGTVRRAQTGSG